MAVVVLAACGATPPSRFYTLSSTPQQPPSGGDAAARSGRQAAPATLLVGTVEIPATLDRPQFVRRAGANTVDVAELDRWSEPLDGMIRRVVADDLAARLGQFRILTSTPPAVAIDRTLVLEIDRFDADRAGTVMLDARWFVLSDGLATPRLSRRSTIEERAASADTEANVAAMSKALGELADEMAGALATLPPTASR